MPVAGFDRLDYLLSKDGETAVSMAPSGNEGGEALFELNEGNWSVTVRAFIGSEPETLAAEGSETFSIQAGTETRITIKLNPVVGEGTGSLNYTLSYPATATVESFALTMLADDSPVTLSPAVTTEGDVTTGTETLTLNAAYYLARVKVKKDGVPVEKGEVVHIYKNMATELELEFIDDDFAAIVVVSSADSGPGTLRQALSDASTGVTILIDLPAADRVITLASPLNITGGIALAIEGNGTTLTQQGFSESQTSQLLYISNTAAEIRISRFHFKGGRASNFGAAIYNKGKLVLESCILSDNRTSGYNSWGGAVYTEGDLSAFGCTFYGNIATGYSGAIHIQNTNSGPAPEGTLVGNVFWGNSPARVRGTVATSGYNRTEYQSSTTWTLTATDAQIFSQPVTSVSFKPLSGSAALAAIDAKPAEYPAVDFYGVPIPDTNAAAGAVQTPVQDGYLLDYAPQGPGEVAVVSENVDSDGIVSGETVTLEASNGADAVFRHWIVDGVAQPAQSTPNRLTLTMTAHTIVRAVFDVLLVVNSSADSGTGSLRAALAAATTGSVTIRIDLPAQDRVITLATPLTLNTNLTLAIEGNGATLTQESFSGSSKQLLYISANAAEVRISRLRFTGGRTTENGAAIRNTGKLVLESCIIDDNSTSVSTAWGGAIRNDGNLIVSGCTFYGNKAGNIGGAVYGNTVATLTLTGNIFWDNTANTYPVIKSSSAVQTGGYNVSDTLSGAGDAQSGWAFDATDTRLTGVSFDSDFRPGHASLPVIPSPPVGDPDLFPLLYFDGTPRSPTSVPGAMPAQTGGS
jgi:hypothetical protein